MGHHLYMAENYGNGAGANHQGASQVTSGRVRVHHVRIHCQS